MIAGMMLASVPAGVLALIAAILLGLSALTIALAYVASGGAMVLLLALVGAARARPRI